MSGSAHDPGADPHLPGCVNLGGMMRELGRAACPGAAPTHAAPEANVLSSADPV
jgi:hypothetical protein